MDFYTAQRVEVLKIIIDLSSGFSVSFTFISSQRISIGLLEVSDKKKKDIAYRYIAQKNRRYIRGAIAEPPWGSLYTIHSCIIYNA